MDLDPEEQFLHDARNGNIEKVRKLLDSRRPGETNININCKGKSKSNLGWTPLHLACYFGHKHVVEELLKELVMLLLQYHAFSTIKNGTAQTPKEVTQDKEIQSMLEAAERTEERKLEELLLAAVREGQTSTLTELLNLSKPPNINCVDLLGNTPLHCTAYRGQKQCALKLLRSGADPGIKNKNRNRGLEHTSSETCPANLSFFRTADPQRVHQTYSAGGQHRSDSSTTELQHLISHRGRWSDAAANKHRQGCKHLTQAVCTVKSRDGSLFSVKCFDDSIHNFKVHPKGAPAVTTNTARVQVCKSLRFYSTKTTTKKAVNPRKFFERVFSDNTSIYIYFKVRSLRLEQEQEKSKILSEALQTLATEHHELEQSVVKRSPSQSVLSEDEFYDAVSDSDSEHSLSGFETVTSHSFDEEPVGYSSSGRSSQTRMANNHGNEQPQSNGIKKRRGREGEAEEDEEDCEDGFLRGLLSRLRPISLGTEPWGEGAATSIPEGDGKERCAGVRDAELSVERCTKLAEAACVAAFTVSAVAGQWERTGKPFNPLLGETYELVREDLGFRLISEQVSHHPPISAFHAEGLEKDFVFHGSIYPKLKFWGKSVEAEPKGVITLELSKHNESYTWTNPTCCVHNIIVGKLWIEQYGNVEIINHETGEKCCLNFKPCGLFGKELHKVEGYIVDKSKKKVCALYGKWTECLYIIDLATFDAHKKNDKKSADEKKNIRTPAGSTTSSEESEEMPIPDAETVEVIPGSQLLWKIAPRPPNSTEMYSFTTFAMHLNESDQEMESVIPKTDCRLRPDIRAMENGDIDLASEEKKRLEEKQRAARKKCSKSDEDWKTRSFASVWSRAFQCKLQQEKADKGSYDTHHFSMPPPSIGNQSTEYKRITKCLVSNAL
ncbi:UNVERIFIED_CONTAM: hypothetical protein FKN15_042436 [Acipenser sinensis]